MTQTLIDHIDSELQNLYLDAQRLKGELASVQTTIRRLTKAREALTGEKSKPKAKPKKAKKPHRNSAEVLQLLHSNADEYTASDVANMLGIPESAAHASLKQLREEGEIDLVRVGGRTKSTKYYKAAMRNATIS